MEPFDIASMFTVYQAPTEQHSLNSTAPTATLAIVAVGITIAAVAGLGVYFYFKKRQH